MLIRARDLQLIAEGRISVVFRRWVRPTVRTGGTLRTAVGVLAIESVEPVVDDGIAPSDAVAAGYADLDALRAELNKRLHGSLFRIRLRLQGPDPRAALRARAQVTLQEAAALGARLDGLDRRSRHGPWTFETLQAIAGTPSCRAADLALRLGLDKEGLKAGIRQLKKPGPDRKPGGRLSAVASRAGVAGAYCARRRPWAARPAAPEA